jgi:hypothetical protein
MQAWGRSVAHRRRRLFLRLFALAASCAASGCGGMAQDAKDPELEPPVGELPRNEPTVVDVPALEMPERGLTEVRFPALSSAGKVDLGNNPRLTEIDLGTVPLPM